VNDMVDSVTIFKFGSCSKCFDETLLLPADAGYTIERVANPAGWNGSRTDVAVITGYLLPEDKDIVEQISANAGHVIAFGTCAVTAGPFGLASARGTKFLASRDVVIDAIELPACLGEWFELHEAIQGNVPQRPYKKLCSACKRRSTCKFLSEVVRQLDPASDEESCFNDRGFACNGYVARQCKEKCIDQFTPCRACKPFVDRPGIRMLSMFGTLLANVEVATEATGGIAGTDKLADEPDDITRGVPDVSGLFFRFSLPQEMPTGKAPTSGIILSDVFTGRTIEELPLIAGMLGGRCAISMQLEIIEAYEQGTSIEVPDVVKTHRARLRELEGQLMAAIENADAIAYGETTEQIRQIAGNMNLSRVYFGGFKTPISGEQASFEDYKAKIIEFKQGTFQAGNVAYMLDAEGKVTQFLWSVKV
jgi:coenzyme F420-reducing hydrogenase gamma subunit